ncbi:helix-turn-helix transcriptional regulator [Streptomyces yaizuensis]|uniref:LuxR family transcriptional regulator n=1 Tax=Streptomyces yaizuensis TaxID=2989713 RepID=A0ABQ5P2Z4_9ACTN|nr:LuxR family transcriptional regulator [Streptomyces sp. YSPA8]
MVAERDPVPVPAPVPVAREPQLRRVRELLKATVAGHGGSLLVDGEPGSGKTALLARVADEAGRLRCRVLAGTAPELCPTPLGALLDCLEPDATTDEIRRTARAGGLTPAGHPATAVRRLFGLIAQTCRTTPVVLVLDNLHRADEASLLVWRRLTETASRRPLLLAAAVPSAPGRPLPRPAARIADSGATRLTLPPLTPREAARHAGVVLGVPPGPRLLRRLGDAAGNVRHLHDLLAALTADGAVRLTADSAELATTGATAEAAAGVTTGAAAGTGGTGSARPARPARSAGPRSPASTGNNSPYPLPPPLAAALTDRLGALSPDVRTTLRIAALLEPPFSRRELAVALERPPGAALPALEEAVAAGIVEEGAPESLRLRSELLRQALHAGVPATLRAAIHARAARSLAGLRAPAHRVAAHLLAADPAGDDWATPWLLGHSAELVDHHPGAALELAGRALDRLPPAHPGRTRLQDAAAQSAYLLHHPDAAGRAKDLHDRTTDPARRHRLGFLTVLALLQDGRPAPARTVVDDALAAAAVTGHPTRTARLLALRAALLCASHRLDEARFLADRVLERSLALQAPVPEAHARSVRAQVLTHTGDHTAALHESTRARAAARRRRETRDLQLVQTLLGAHLLGAHDRDGEARALLDDARSLAGTTGSPARRAWVHTVAARFHYRAGRWDEALDSLDLGHPPPAPWLPVPPHGLDAVILAARDQRDAARARLTAARAAAPADTDPAYLPLAAALIAERDGDPGTALTLLRDSLAPGGPPTGRWAHQATRLPDTVRIALALGDHALARDAVAAAEAAAAHAPGAPGPRALAQRLSGLVGHDPGPLTAAADHYLRQGMRLCHARTLEDLAAVLAARGDTDGTDGARARLTAAVDLYRSIGAHGYTARADARLRSLGVRRGPRGPRGTKSRPGTGWDALTPTELRVALLVAEGRSNPETAAELLLSPRTVQTHVSHILAKLGVRTRIDIGREAGRRRPPHGPPHGPPTAVRPAAGPTTKETDDRDDRDAGEPRARTGEPRVRAGEPRGRAARVDRPNRRDPAAEPAHRGTDERPGPLPPHRG